MDESLRTVESILPILVWLVPTVIGVFILTFGRVSRAFREELAALGLLITFVISVMITARVIRGEILIAWNTQFYVDGLSALMEILGSSMGIIILLYSLRYLTHTHPESTTSGKLSLYYGLLLLFLGMMNWTCATNNMVMLYVSLEATTLATAFLVTFYWRRESLEAGFKYLMLVTVGIAFALFGSILIYSAVVPYLPAHKTLFLSEVGKITLKIPPNIILLATVFMIAGFGTKAGLIPFHAWLPDAHAEAPVPISALLSGIVIKVGAYALARTVTIFAPHYNAIVVFVAILASVSMVIGMFMALVQDDLKRMLAYSSISQIAYVVEGLGMGTYLGIYGGLFHLLNHTIIKALLFLSVGAIIYRTGTRKISQLGNLGKKMPLTAICFFIGALSISGLPPFNGFMSKLTLFLAVAERRMFWAAAIAVFTGLLTTACFVLAAVKVFWGKLTPEEDSLPKTEDEDQIREVPISMWISMVGLALLCLILGVYPHLAYPLLDSATRCVLKIAGG